jgi:hypothetical protein
MLRGKKRKRFWRGSMRCKNEFKSLLYLCLMKCRGRLRVNQVIINSEISKVDSHLSKGLQIRFKTKPTRKWLSNSNQLKKFKPLMKIRVCQNRKRFSTLIKVSRHLLNSRESSKIRDRSNQFKKTLLRDISSRNKSTSITLKSKRVRL